MKVVLFCQHPYEIGILEALQTACKENGDNYIWFLMKRVENLFPFPDEPHTTSLGEIAKFKADVIFAPGNTLPYYLRGLKVQVFHGLAGEKKSHFKIRGFFDAYFTQGPYFTKRFEQLKAEHQDFEVAETGWPKFDIFSRNKKKYDIEKLAILKEHDAKIMVLFAPTHNANMISAPHLLDEFKKLSENRDFLTIVKFHSETGPEIIEKYKEAFKDTPNLVISTEGNINKLLMMADVLVSDTSSVVYEFQFLDKPVLTFKTQATNVLWDDSEDYANLEEKIKENLEIDRFGANRKKIIADYHPYDDGNSSLRMLAAAKKIITEKGVPKKRKVPLGKKIRIFKLFRLRNN